MENKQIEEMVIALTESQHEFDKAWHDCLHNGGKQPERENVFYAKYLIEKKGYRRASELIYEIEKYILEGATTIESVNSDAMYGAKFAIEKVVLPILEAFKKKYTEEGK